MNQNSKRLLEWAAGDAQHARECAERSKRLYDLGCYDIARGSLSLAVQATENSWYWTFKAEEEP